MGGGTSSNTTTATQNLTPQQQGLVSLAYPQYQQFAASNPTLPTGKQAVAPFNPNQVAGQNAVIQSTGVGQDQGPVAGTPTGSGGQWSGSVSGGAPNSFDPTGGAPNMTGTVGTAANTNQYLSSGAFLDPGSNPYVQNAVSAAIDPIQQQLTRTTLPGISAAAPTGAGGMSANFGGSRQGIAEANAINDATRNEGNVASQIMEDALGKGLTATGQAIAQAPTTAGSLALPGATREAVGSEQQTQAQNVLNANNQASWFAQMLPLLKAQELTSGAQGLPGGSTTSVGQGTTDPGLFANLVGGASALGGLLGGAGKLAGAGGLSALLPFLGAAG